MQGLIVGFLSLAGLRRGRLHRLAPRAHAAGGGLGVAVRAGVRAGRRAAAGRHPGLRPRAARLPLRHRLGRRASGWSTASAAPCWWPASGSALAWVAGAVALQTPGAPGLREPIQRSSVLTRLNEILPPSGSLLQALARFDPFPTITGPEPGRVGPRRGASRAIPRCGRRAAASSACWAPRAGSACRARAGWPATAWWSRTRTWSPARTTRPVQLGGEGERFDAQAIHFDVRNDLAVLRVPGVAGVRPLPMNEAARPGTGAAVLGFPENGPYDVEPARVGRTRTVVSQDAYGRGPVQRRITALRGLVRSGNSGGPAVDGQGRVVDHDLRRRARVRQRQRLRGAGLDRAPGAGAQPRARVHRPLLALSRRRSRYEWRRCELRSLLAAGRRAGGDSWRPPAPASAQKSPNPCLDAAQRAQLRCPDLIMRRPFGLRSTRSCAPAG